MVTPDVIVDRRIILEARTLLDEGFDVYVLAAPTHEHDQYRRLSGVPVEHVRLPEPPMRERFELARLAVVTRLMGLPFPPGSGRNPLTDPLARRANAGSEVFRRLHRTERSVAVFAARARASAVWRGTRFAIWTTNTAARVLSRLSRPRGQTARFYPYEHAFIERTLAYRPDIVHVHDLPLLRVGREIQRRLGTKLVYDMHEFFPEQRVLSPESRERFRALERTHIGAADLRITVNPRLAQAIATAYGNVDIRVVQNAVGVPSDLHQNRFDLLREEHGAPAERPILLFQGWIAPRRNLEALVEGVITAHQAYTLVLMGYGEYHRELLRLANDSDRVMYIESKPQETLLYYTASADLGVIPYSPTTDVNTRFASPNKLYEFIAARLPILSNRLEFIESIVTTNGFGLVRSLDSPVEVAAALDEFPLHRLAEFRANLTERGSAFLWETEQERLVTAYNEMLGTVCP